VNDDGHDRIFCNYGTCDGSVCAVRAISQLLLLGAHRDAQCDNFAEGPLVLPLGLTRRLLRPKVSESFLRGRKYGGYAVCLERRGETALRIVKGQRPRCAAK